MLLTVKALQGRECSLQTSAVSPIIPSGPRRGSTW
uniref:Uncharacterized protein n=1 Tax=Catharus ustulatus TaxID=91951 RepID=A0A8C3UZV1_CATUS